jgi:hypothetical protein
MMNQTLLITSLVLVGTVVPALVLLFRGLLSSGKSLPSSVEWIQEVCASRYRPMERLLRPEDFDFLASQPGYTRQIGRRLRSERRKVFRGYLRWMKRDFDHVCLALQLLMVNSMVDRPDLASVLVRQKAAFHMAMVAVEFRLLLHACGVDRMVDVRDLVGVLDALGGELRQLIPVATPA